MGLARAGGEIGLGAGMAFWRSRPSWRPAGEHPDRPASGDRGRGGLAPALAGSAGSRSFLAAGPPGERQPEESAPLAVAAIQADVALADKWDDAQIDSTKVPYAEPDRAKRPTPAPSSWSGPRPRCRPTCATTSDLLDWVRAVVRDNGGLPLHRLPRRRPRTPTARSAPTTPPASSTPTGTLSDRYAKHHLLPIGEAMPFQRYLPFLAGLDVGQAEWTPGRPPVPMTVSTGRATFRFSGLICFESVFGRAGPRRRARRQPSAWWSSPTTAGSARRPARASTPPWPACAPSSAACR